MNKEKSTIKRQIRKIRKILNDKETTSSDYITGILILDLLKKRLQEIEDGNK